MKSSKFNSIIKFDSIYYAIFNTLTEKYFLFKSDKYNDLISVLSSPYVSDRFSETQKIYYDKCVIDKFLVDDTEDEFLDYSEKFKTFNDDSKFNITLYNNENNSNSLNFWLNFTNNISKLIEKVSVKYKKLEISWFVTGEYTRFGFHSILTDKFNEICQKNKCLYSSSILIHDKFPEHLETLIKTLFVNNIEINISSCSDEEAHNLADNINKIFKVKENIRINLIISLYDDNAINVTTMLKLIDYQNRNKIDIIFYNNFSFSPELFLYNMYMETINIGYKFSYLDKFSSLICSLKSNSYCIDSDLKIASCVGAAKANDYFAKLDSNGLINIFNKDLYFRYLNASSIHNYKCIYCPELPICPSNYPYYRITSKALCIKDIYHDLTLEHKIKLRFFSDTVIDKIKPQII